MGLKFTMTQMTVILPQRLKSDHNGIEICSFLLAARETCRLKSDHNGIEIFSLLNIGHSSQDKLKSDHNGIEMQLFQFLSSLSCRLKSDHNGIEMCVEYVCC